jgi:cyclopropane-fatty-acyl-phospholipid synthase
LAAGSAVATLLFKERSALYGWMWDPELNFGETYMAGLVTVEGDLLALLEAIYRAFARPKRRAWWLWQKSNDTRAARENVNHHYDLGNDFFKLILDPGMVYSSAYFKHDSDALELAQLQKFERLCDKLHPSPASGSSRQVAGGARWRSSWPVNTV